MSERTEEITVLSSTVQLPEDNSPVRERNAPIATIQGEQQASAIGAATTTMTPEERAKKKAFLVTALERGVTNDRMKVDLPPHLHGEWVRRDQFEIDQMKRLGFEIDTQYATSRALNTDGTGAAFIADVVYMTTTRENKELIDEVKHEKFLAVNSKKGNDREEKEFAGATHKETGGIIPTMAESKVREAKRDDISAALEAMENQTRTQV